MSYGQRPQAWARPTGAGASQQLNPNLFTNQLTGLVGPAQPFGNLGPLGLNALVNQAAFTNMNQVLAQAQRAQQLIPQAVAPQQPSPPSRNQKTFIGTVTKLMDNYGFIDDDVFFQTSVIRGALPRVGDRVMTEASYNPSMPFKWNAYSIRLVQQHEVPQSLVKPNQSAHARSSSSAVNAAGSAGEGVRNQQQRQSSRRSPLLARRSSPHQRQRSPPTMRSRTPERSSRRSPPSHRTNEAAPKRERSVGRERERSVTRRAPSQARDSGRNRSPSVLVAGRRDSLSRESPPRRRQRIIPRYHCYVPKPLPAGEELKYGDLHKRYPQLYVPSDFLQCDMSWLRSFPLEEQISFSPHPTTFYVMHKDVDVPLEEGATPPVDNPPDADSRYVVKVLLFSHPGCAAIRQKAYGLLPDGSIDENGETQPILKSLLFLHGLRGKNELMCIGGAWSPSLDGENPLDPQTLVKTAARTTLVAIGLDLSSCSKWYKMAHLRYYRAEKNRVDSVVLMLPDLSAAPNNLMPSTEAYAQTEERIKAQLAAKLAAIDAEEFIPPNSLNPSTTASSVVDPQQDKGATSHGGQPQQSQQPAPEGNGMAQPATAASGDGEQNSEASSAMAEGNEASTTKGTATHWSQLNIKAMKVAELREELEVRGLDFKGVKNALVQRLQKAADREKVDDEQRNPSTESKTIKEENMDTDDLEIIAEVKNAATVDIPPAEELVERRDDEIPDATAQAKKSEKEQKELERAKEKFEKEKKERKAVLERHYITPKDPCILIFPNKLAKGGRFECRVSSLSALLDYRSEDNKELSFEVFLFAEAFKEAMDRSYAFSIFKTIACSLDKELERKRRNLALIGEQNGSDTPVADESSKPADSEVADKQSKQSAKEEKKKEIDPRTLYKAVVGHADLFAMFAHFDQNVCGYIEERHFEEIVYSLRLDISRADMQRLTKKLSSQEKINYRNLTDKWVDKEGNVKYCHPIHSSAASQNAVDPAFDHYNLVAAGKTGANLGGEAILGQTPDVSEAGVVCYRGTVLNIAQVVEQQKVVEDERDASVLKAQELEFTLKTTKEQKEQVEKKKRRLEDDLDRSKKKLHETEKNLKSLQDSAAEMKTALQSCKRYADRVMESVDKVIPPPRKEKTKKTEDSKEKSEAKQDITATEQSTDAAGATAPAAEKPVVKGGEHGGAEHEDATMETFDFVLAEEVNDEGEKADAHNVAAPQADNAMPTQSAT